MASVVEIAAVCHAVNRAWCQLNGDNSQKEWNEAEDWQRQSAIKGVEYRLEHPEDTPQAQHEAWMMHKIKEGWTQGPKKDAEKKQHDCLVPYDQLPEFQKKKDKLFVAVVDALK